MMSKAGYMKFIQGTLALWQLFLAGSTFSIGVFVPSVEGSARPQHALDDIWETGMGAMHFLCGPVMIAATVFLTAGKQSVPRVLKSKTVRARLLAFITLLAYFSLVFSAHGIRIVSRIAVFTGVAMQAVPLAIRKSQFPLVYHLFSLLIETRFVS